MKTNGSGGTQWFEKLQGGNAGAMKLFCFPHAGGSAQTFRGWQQYLSPEINLCLAHLPGKGPRIQERPFTDIKKLVAALADAIVPHIQDAFAFWGHSMGALVSFELARELQRRNERGPLALVVSGRGSPQNRDPRPSNFRLPDAELLSRLRGLKGTPEELLNSPESKALFLPIIRADFELVETYRFEPARLLECPIFAYNGLEDVAVSPESARGWKDHTTMSSSCKVRMFPGNHFFIFNRIADMAPSLRRDLLEALSRVATGLTLHR